MYRISVDTGGTFTDVVVSDPQGRLTIGKALTTPERSFDGTFCRDIKRCGANWNFVQMT